MSESKHDETERMAEALERLAREFAKHSGPSSTDRERDVFSRDLRNGALRYARAYYAEARELGLIPEHAPTVAPIEIGSDEVRAGDVIVAWQFDGGSDWSRIGVRGDMRVVSRGTDAAFVASGDRISLGVGYRWQVRRAP